jgi:hypothetical protein
MKQKSKVTEAEFRLAEHFDRQYEAILEKELSRDTLSILRLIELLSDHKYNVHLAILALKIK